MSEFEGDPVLREIFDFSTDLLVVLGEDGHIIACSPAIERIHGYPPGKLAGESFQAKLHLEDRESVDREIAWAFEHENHPIDLRYRYRDADGSLRWMEGSACARRDREGRLRLFASLHDASRQVERELEAGRSLAAKDELLHETQHRVKNSIAMISSFVALEEGRTDNPELRAVLEDLRFRIESVASLYRILLSSGNPRIVNLKAYLERLVMDLSMTLERSEISTRIDMEELWIDTGQAGPIGILCTELLSNALRHGYPKGRGGIVEVGLRADGDALELRVEDDGEGLPETFKLELSEGLGLQLASMLAQQLRGKLVAERRESGGTRFVFRMPRKTGD